MGKDIRTYYAEFNDESMRIFFSLFNEFRNETGNINRGNNENVFQMLRAKYIAVLKQRLGRSAETLIQQCDSAESQGRLRIGFSEKINYLSAEFLRKSGLL